MRPDGAPFPTPAPALDWQSGFEALRGVALDRQSTFRPDLLAPRPISVRGSADTILGAFAQAGAWALLSITVLLWMALRRLTDVLLTLVQLYKSLGGGWNREILVAQRNHPTQP